jgi:hypothetical protein
MSNYQRFHYSLTRAYGKGIITAQQVAEMIAIYRGLK